MKYILNKFRYCEDNKSTISNYLKAVKQYYEHLNKIDFTCEKDLLKYFGNSFFHDSKIIGLNFDPNLKQIIMKIYRDNDREDINTFRSELNLSKYSEKKYIKKDILYQCQFTGVDNFDESLICSKQSVKNIIMDTEIGFNKNKNKYHITIGFSKDNEMSFMFNKCKVKLLNKELINNLTNNLKTNVPYCKQCKSLILTKSKIVRTINEVDFKIKTEREERRRRMQR